MDGRVGRGRGGALPEAGCKTARDRRRKQRPSGVDGGASPLSEVLVHRPPAIPPGPAPALCLPAPGQAFPPHPSLEETLSE